MICNHLIDIFKNRIQSNLNLDELHHSKYISDNFLEKWNRLVVKSNYEINGIHNKSIKYYLLDGEVVIQIKDIEGDDPYLTTCVELIDDNRFSAHYVEDSTLEKIVNNVLNSNYMVVGYFKDYIFGTINKELRNNVL